MIWNTVNSSTSAKYIVYTVGHSFPVMEVSNTVSNIDDNPDDRLTSEVAFIVPPRTYDQLRKRARSKGYKTVPHLLRVLLKKDVEEDLVPPGPRKSREIKVMLTPQQHCDVLRQAESKNFRSPSEYMRALIESEFDGDLAPPTRTTRTTRILNAALSSS